MVNYMWGGDVADALIATDDAPKLDDAWASGAVRFNGKGLSGDAMPLRMPIEFKPIDKVGLPADPNDEYDFDVSPDEIERAIRKRGGTAKSGTYLVGNGDKEHFMTHDCPDPDALMALREAIAAAREAGNYTTYTIDWADPTSRVVRRDYVSGKLVRTYRQATKPALSDDSREER